MEKTNDRARLALVWLLADHGPHIERGARRAGRLVAAAAAAAVLLAVLTFEAGRRCRLAIEAASQFAADLVTDRAAAAATAATVAATLAGVLAGVLAWAGRTVAADGAADGAAAAAARRQALEALKVAELRTLARAAGLRQLARSGRRADLLAALTA